MNPRIKTRLTIAGLVVWLLLMAGCGRSADTTPTAPSIVNPTTTNSPTSSPTPRPSAIPAPTATPTPPPTRLTAADQSVDDSGRIIVAEALTQLSGWLVLSAQESAEPLAVAPLAPGLSQDIPLLADPLTLPRQVTITLYSDNGIIGQFEPEVDQPVLHDGVPLTVTIRLDLQITLPQITVADQAVGEDGILTVDTVVAPQPGWVVIYNDDADAWGAPVGFEYVKAGVNRFVNVPIRWRQATPRLHVVLHADGDRPNRFDYPPNDAPVLVRGEPVQTTLRATFPPDVVVLSQPIVDGQIVVERVISDGPGWIAASYQNQDGTLGNIIGFAPLQDGINGPVAIPLLTALVTPKLFLQLHKDTDDIGEFGFPGADPVVLYQDRQKLFTVDTTSGNYVISRDQTATEQDGTSTVTVAYVVGDISMWVVIRADDDGQPGAVVGQALAMPGVNREIVIPIDLAQATPQLHAVLHVDNGTIGAFEFVDNNQLDYELLRFRQIIDAPFRLISAETP